MRLTWFLLIVGVAITVCEASLRDLFKEWKEELEEDKDGGINMKKLRSDFLKRFKGLGKGKLDELSEEERENFIRSFNRTNIESVHEKLGKLRSAWRNKLKNSNATEEAANERLKKYKKKLRNRVKPEGDTLPEVNAKANLTEFMYQGDIILTVEQADHIVEEATDGSQTREKRQAYRDRAYPSTTWGTTVYYYFDRTATAEVKSVFQKAAAYWQANTCINFEESSNQRNRIRVFKGQGCYSYIGRIGGVQELSLGRGCDSVGTAAHEIGHALGFFHTQSRADRDSAITVMISNIERDFVDQFDKESSSTNYNYGMPYDYGSIMQYGAESASRNGQPTMVAVSPNTNYQDTMGSDIVAFYDVSMMNEHYNCKANCLSQSSANCQNGGFPNPRRCSSCVCPSGYGGNLCDQRPSGCGQTMTATSSWQTMSDSIGDGSRNVKEEFEFCNYWIQAPAGARVEVKLNSYQGSFVDGCVFNGVEIKTHEDQKRTGYRFCSNSDAGTTLTSSSNVVPVITFNRYSRSTTSLQYRIVDGTGTGTGTGGTGTGGTGGTGTTTGTGTGGTGTGGTGTGTGGNGGGSSECADRSRNCGFLSYFGFCSRRHVRRSCKMSCGQC